MFCDFSHYFSYYHIKIYFFIFNILLDGYDIILLIISLLTII